MPVKSVEEYIATHANWESELAALRALLLNTELEETIKWGAPVYCLEGKNVIGLAAFKNHCAIWFFQGALLNDSAGLLYNAQEGKTKALRQIRFEKGDELQEKALQKYIKEAIENQREGREVRAMKEKKMNLPAELKNALKKDSDFKLAFDNLSPGKQREYAEHIGSAKRETTRISRLEKAIPLILKGEGLNDKYK
jgi:uncharacterized protein YdeI (YjbR/CyaY-like superfamily)